MLAIFAVLVVLLPISWMLFRYGTKGLAADNEVPSVEWVDDRYQSAKPTVADWMTTEPTLTPSDSPTETPTDDPTSTPSPSTTPSDDPSTTPTDHPTSRPTSPGQTRTPTTRPTNTNSPTTRPPSTPSDDGSMSRVERELFDLIGGARAEQGCGPLRPDSNLTGTARDHAKKQVKKNDTNTGGGTDAISDNESARAAFDEMMSQYSSVLLDCSMDRLGIGWAEDRNCPLILCIKDETRFVADFARG